MAEDAPPLELAWEMSISRAEFERSLPAALGELPRRVGPLAFEWGDARRGGRAEALPIDALRIALIALPRHRVTLRLFGYGADTAAFLHRWDLHFRRGGG